MAVIFDCSSDIAMFRKPYTTTSSVSFAFLPPTAAAGLICAIIGEDNESANDGCNAAYWRKMAGTSIAIKICSPVRWFRGALNFWNVKEPQKSPHIQVKHQFLYAPKYRIFVKGTLEERLNERLSKEEFIYTPYLGMAYAISDIAYVGKCEDTHFDSYSGVVDSVVPLADGVSIDFSETKRIFKEIVPFEFDDKRALVNSLQVLYSDGINKIVLKEKGKANVARCMEDVIAWFPEW